MNDPNNAPTRALVLLGLLALGLAGCGPYGDGAAYSRNARIEAERRRADMQLATDQSERGEPVVGEALQSALAGHYMEFHYGSFPGGESGDYRQREFFAADGRFVSIDNQYQRSLEAAEGDRWRAEGERFCFRLQRFSEAEQCFRLYRRADSRWQWYIDDPESPYHGLLTRDSNAYGAGPLPAFPP